MLQLPVRTIIEENLHLFLYTRQTLTLHNRMDSYTIYAASVLAATAMLRSFFGAAFPLFVSQMYAALGIHWASSVPAFLTLVMLPFPFVLYKYGAAIRMKCKYAQDAAAAMARMQAQASPPVAARMEDPSSDGSETV